MRQKHPMCAGAWTDTPGGRDFDCGDGTTIGCDDCKYGAMIGRRGGKDPEAKCNQPKEAKP